MRRADPPDGIANIVCNQQSSLFVDSNTDRTAHGIAVAIQKPRQHIDG